METFAIIAEILVVGFGVGILSAVSVVIFILKVCEWDDEKIEEEE